MFVRGWVLRGSLQKAGGLFFDFVSKGPQPGGGTVWGTAVSAGSVLVASAVLPAELNSEKRIKREELEGFHWKK